MKKYLTKFIIVSTSIMLNSNLVNAQQLSTQQIQFLLNRYCNDYAQIAYGIGQIIGGGNTDEIQGLSPGQCKNLYQIYQRRIQSNQRNNLHQEYNRIHGRDGRYTDYNLESIYDSNRLAR